MCVSQAQGLMNFIAPWDCLRGTHSLLARYSLYSINSKLLLSQDEMSCAYKIPTALLMAHPSNNEACSSSMCVSCGYVLTLAVLRTGLHLSP